MDLHGGLSQAIQLKKATPKGRWKDSGVGGDNLQKGIISEKQCLRCARQGSMNVGEPEKRRAVVCPKEKERLHQEMQDSLELERRPFHYCEGRQKNHGLGRGSFWGREQPDLFVQRVMTYGEPSFINLRVST